MTVTFEHSIGGIAVVAEDGERIGLLCRGDSAWYFEPKADGIYEAELRQIADKLAELNGKVGE